MRHSHLRNPKRRRALARRHLISRIRRQKAEIAHFLNDLAYWNERHPEAEIPLDPQVLDESRNLDRMLRELSP